MATDKETEATGLAIVMMRDHDEPRRRSVASRRRLMGRPLVVNEAVSKKG